MRKPFHLKSGPRGSARRKSLSRVRVLLQGCLTKNREGERRERRRGGTETEGRSGTGVISCTRILNMLEEAFHPAMQ